MPLHHEDHVIGGLAIVQDTGYIGAQTRLVWRDAFLRVLVQVVIIAPDHSADCAVEPQRPYCAGRTMDAHSPHPAGHVSPRQCPTWISFNLSPMKWRPSPKA